MAELAALAVLAAGTQPACAQAFVYIEPGLPSCPTEPAPSAARVVRVGAATPGSISVRCGFDQGSYTVTLNSTDPAATLAPKSFVVNFGRLSGRGTFTVTFSTPGPHTVSAAITANMGSPAVGGRFVSATSEFTVVNP